MFSKQRLERRFLIFETIEQQIALPQQYQIFPLFIADQYDTVAHVERFLRQQSEIAVLRCFAEEP